METQLKLAMMNDELGQARTSKKEFLDKIESIRLEIAERKRIEVQIKQLQERLIRYAKLIGIHRSYRPVRNVNYDDYTLFMSTVAHDYKTLDRENFIVKYMLIAKNDIIITGNIYWKFVKSSSYIFW